VSLIVEQKPVILILIRIFQMPRYGDGMTCHDDKIFSGTCDAVGIL
jgi:hypothetical protein